MTRADVIVVGGGLLPVVLDKGRGFPYRLNQLPSMIPIQKLVTATGLEEKS